VRDRPLLLISVAADSSIYLRRTKMYEPEGATPWGYELLLRICWDVSIKMMELIKTMNYYFVTLIFQPCFPVMMYWSVKVWNQTDKSYGRARSEPGGTRWPTWGEVKGKLANGVGSQYSHATSERGISSITKVDAHTSTASSRLNWRPHRFEWTHPFQGKTKSGFCACAITFHMSYNIEVSSLLALLQNWKKDGLDLSKTSVTI